MADTTILLNELEGRGRRFLEMARRVGVPAEQLAEQVLTRFPPPEEPGESGELLTTRVAEVARVTGIERRIVLAAALLPPGRVEAFEAVQAALAFRKRLEEHHGGPFSSSTPLIRADRDR